MAKLSSPSPQPHPQARRQVPCGQARRVALQSGSALLLVKATLARHTRLLVVGRASVRVASLRRIARSAPLVSRRRRRVLSAAAVASTLSRQMRPTGIACLFQYQVIVAADRKCVAAVAAADRKERARFYARIPLRRSGELSGADGTDDRLVQVSPQARKQLCCGPKDTRTTGEQSGRRRKRPVRDEDKRRVDLYAALISFKVALDCDAARQHWRGACARRHGAVGARRPLGCARLHERLGGALAPVSYLFMDGSRDATVVEPQPGDRFGRRVVAARLCANNEMRARSRKHTLASSQRTRSAKPVGFCVRARGKR